VLIELKKQSWSHVHESRQAAIVAAETVLGVVKVHDHLRWMDPVTGISIESPEDKEYAKAS
jgi:hypothetical protein